MSPIPGMPMMPGMPPAGGAPEAAPSGAPPEFVAAVKALSAIVDKLEGMVGLSENTEEAQPTAPPAPAPKPPLPIPQTREAIPGEPDTRRF